MRKDQFLMSLDIVGIAKVLHQAQQLYQQPGPDPGANAGQHRQHPKAHRKPDEPAACRVVRLGFACAGGSGGRGCLHQLTECAGEGRLVKGRMRAATRCRAGHDEYEAPCHLRMAEAKVGIGRCHGSKQASRTRPGRQADMTSPGLGSC